jgi:hypothetical protein
MKHKLSRNFRLVPALEPQEGTLSPAAFFPAIPVSIGEMSQPIVYATLDVSLQISRLSPQLLKQANIPSIDADHPASPQGIILLHLPVTIRDQDLEPWLYFRNIPFSIAPELGTGTNASQMVLGSRGFLAHIRLSIDFPRKTMRITPPRRFLVAQPPSRAVAMPSSLVQAEDLIDAGSYSSAVVLIASGLEQSLLPPMRGMYSSSTSGELAESVRRSTGDPALSNAVLQMYGVRNRAVHGTEQDRITEAEAREVLSTAKRLLRKSQQSAQHLAAADLAGMGRSEDE